MQACCDASPGAALMRGCALQVAAEAAAKKAAAEAAAREAAETQRAAERAQVLPYIYFLCHARRTVTVRSGQEGALGVQAYAHLLRAPKQAEEARGRQQAEEEQRRREAAAAEAAAAAQGREKAEAAARAAAPAADGASPAGAERKGDNASSKGDALRAAPGALEAEKQFWAALRAAEVRRIDARPSCCHVCAGGDMPALKPPNGQGTILFPCKFLGRLQLRCRHHTSVRAHLGLGFVNEHVLGSCVVQDLVRPLVADEAQKRERRKLDKFVTLNVQQISGTQQQVGPGLPLWFCCCLSSCCCTGVSCMMRQAELGGHPRRRWRPSQARCRSSCAACRRRPPRTRSCSWLGAWSASASARWRSATRPRSLSPRSPPRSPPTTPASCPSWSPSCTMCAYFG